MPFDTDEQDLLKRSFDIEINRVGPAPDLEMLLGRRGRVRLQEPTSMTRRRVALPAAIVIVLTGLVVTGALLLPGEDAAAPGAGESSTTVAASSSTDPAASTSSTASTSPTTSATNLAGTDVWLSVGEPISDEQFLSLLGEEGWFGFVPGTAVQLAWRPEYLGEFEIGLFAIQQESPEMVEEEWYRYCMTSYAAPIGGGNGDHTGGGGPCTRSVEELHALLSEFGIGGSGNCVDMLHEVHIWGVPADVEFVEVLLRDGTSLIAAVDAGGYALFAWDHDTPWTGITYDGISAEHEALVDSWIPESPMSCAESSAAKPG